MFTVHPVELFLTLPAGAICSCNGLRCGCVSPCCVHASERSVRCVYCACMHATSLLPMQVPVPNTRNFSMFGSSLDSVTVVRGGKALQATPTPPALSSTPPSTLPLPLPLPSNGLVQAVSIVVQPVVPGKTLSNSSSTNGSPATAGNTTPTAERKVSQWVLDQLHLPSSQDCRRDNGCHGYSNGNCD